MVGGSLKRGKANQLKEQGSLDINFDRRYGTAAAAEKSNKENRELVNTVLNINPHTRNEILAIATAFIPVVGPFISAGIGLYDAKQYYDEGDKKTAGLVAMFSIIPGVGTLLSKIPGVKQLGKKGMTALATKLSKGVKITNPVEVRIINGIGKNRQLIQQELNKSAKEMSIRAAKNKAKTQLIKKNVTKTASSLSKQAAGYGVGSLGYNAAYDYVDEKKQMEILRKQEQADIDKLNAMLGIKKK